MEILRGIQFNIRGLMMGLRTPSLLMLGLLRFLVFLLIGVGAAVIFFAYHQDIMLMIWAKPASLWLVWLWYLASWLLSLVLIALTSVAGFHSGCKFVIGIQMIKGGADGRERE